MEWSKVKNIIIVILLLVNGFLLILVGGQWQKVRSYEKTALTGAAQVLEQNGILVSDEALAQAAEGAPPSMTAGRDAEREAAIAATLLGEDAACTDQSGGLYVYSGSGGMAIFRANGDFTITLPDFPVKLAEDELFRHAEGLLESMRVEGEYIGMDADSGFTRIAYRQTLDGVPLYNCEIVFAYSEGCLRTVGGTLLVCDEPEEATDGEEPLGVSTALIRFLEGILDRRDLCSAVTAIRPGYLSTQSFGAAAYLTPIWLVSTDISDYYLNGITGELTPVS